MGPKISYKKPRPDEEDFKSTGEESAPLGRGEASRRRAKTSEDIFAKRRDEKRREEHEELAAAF